MVLHEDIPWWGTLLAQILGGLGVIIAAWVKLLPKIKEWRKARAKGKAKKEVLENARILRAMHILIREWRVNLSAQRVLLLYARNGGKPWPITDRIRVSCLDQTTDGTAENTWGRWQDWFVDPPYRELLADVLNSEESEKGILNITETMSNSVLKEAYEAQGTVASILFPIGWITNENALIYVSINFGRSTPRDEDLSEAERETYVNIAKGVFNAPDRVRRMQVSAHKLWENK